MNKFTVSGSPHIHGDESNKKIMYGVVIAMIPTMLFSNFIFLVVDAIRVFLIAIIASFIF